MKIVIFGSCVYLHRGHWFTKSPSMNDIFKQNVNKHCYRKLKKNQQKCIFLAFFGCKRLLNVKNNLRSSIHTKKVKVA